MFTRLQRRPGTDTSSGVGRPGDLPAPGACDAGVSGSDGAPALGRIAVLLAETNGGGPADPFHGSGKHVAAAAWMRALVRCGPARMVDIYGPMVQLDACRNQLQDLLTTPCGDAVSTTSLLPESELAARFFAQRYAVAHGPAALDLTQASYLRSRFSPTVFPITCSQHGISYRFELEAVFVRLLTAQIYECDAVVCLSRAAQLAMEKRLLDIAERYSRAWNAAPPRLPRLELIPWGVDAEQFTLRDKAQARRDLGLPLDRPIVLCVGRLRLEDKMDWTPLLLAFERVSHELDTNPLFVLAGATLSDYRDYLLSQAAEMGLRPSLRTFFNLPPACLPWLYAACDVFVSPSDSASESFGLTVLEAMACGRPVVASDWDGYKDLVIHGETGFRVRTDWADCLDELNDIGPLLSWDQDHLHLGQSVSVDVAEMAGYLVELLLRPELREEMGRRGRTRVEELYDWPVVIRQWEGMWTELGAIARTIRQKEMDRLDYLRPEHFAHFCHYASRIVDGETPVRLTTAGREVLSGSRPLRLHPWAQGILHPEPLRACLCALKPAAWLHTTLPAGQLVDVVRRVGGMSTARAMMHLMWLAKYDLVSLGGAAPLPRMSALGQEQTKGRSDDLHRHSRL